MDPVEINAGAWYLRGLRADDRIDDRPALADLGETDPGYIAGAATRWARDTGYTWGVCEPTTGELLAEVTLDPGSGAITTRSRRGHSSAARTAAETVSRFAADALALVPQLADPGGAAAAEQDPADSADGGDRHQHTPAERPVGVVHRGGGEQPDQPERGHHQQNQAG